jgi:hypothetical protein
MRGATETGQISSGPTVCLANRERLAFWLFGTFGTKKDVILKNEPEKLLKIQAWPSKTNRNEPENEAEKLLKTRSCGKNKAKNKATDVVENK